jgi:hypothetical protein
MRAEELERELRADRPEPDPEFARRLDDWAAAGFPRDRGLGPRPAGGRLARGGLARAWQRLTSIPPRRLLMPVGAATTLLVVVGIAINGGRSESGGGEVTSSFDSGGSGADSESSASAQKEVAPDVGQGALLEAGAADEAVTPYPVPPSDDGGGIARGTDDRIVDATARITLGAETGDVQGVANGVVEVTDRYNGVVLESQVTTDQAGARAGFALEIPYSRLDAALADLSGLADVISRTEAGEDITARAVRAQKNLADVFEQIRKARIELIQADAREERLIVKSRISSLEAQADAFEAELNNVQRQGRFATVNVDITSDGPGSEGGDWTLGDALGDAGRVIEVIGGIALVSLAVLLPIALVGALAWLIAARARRHRRERALDA